MRLCFLADPGSIHTQRWLRYFSAAGHEVHLINCSPQPMATFEWPGATHHNIPTPAIRIRGLRGLVTRWARARGIKAFLRQLRPDVIHAHYINGPGWDAALANFHPLVLTAWGSDVLVDLRHGAWPDRILSRLALRRADLVTADSRQVMDIARPFMKAHAQATLIRFGIDTRYFTPGEDGYWRGRLGLGNSRVVLSARQCSRNYNIDTIVEALPLVRQAVPDTRLLIKQLGQTDRDAYCIQLRARIGELGLADSVDFVPTVPYTEMPGLYRCADVVVSVPSSDGMPVSVLEAMACGTPVVASDLPALRELAGYGASLALVPPRNPSSLADALIQTLRSPDHVGAIAQNLATVRRVGDFETEMQRMGALYGGLAG
jgi:glycosyltransferase involved in cell wall biosynthesis